MNLKFNDNAIFIYSEPSEGLQTLSNRANTYVRTYMQTYIHTYILKICIIHRYFVCKHRNICVEEAGSVLIHTVIGQNPLQYAIILCRIDQARQCFLGLILFCWGKNHQEYYTNN